MAEWGAGAYGGGGGANKVQNGICASITSRTILIATKKTPQYPTEIVG